MKFLWPVGVSCLLLVLSACQAGGGETRREPEPSSFRSCELSVSAEDWERLHVDVHRDVEVDATFRLDGAEAPIELELQGSSTLVHPKRSLKLKFNQGQRLFADVFLDGGDPEGLGRLILKAMYKDQSMIREALSFEIARHMGLIAPRVDWCELHLNGAYHGLFAMVEPLDEEYLAHRGFASGGSLYKAVAQNADFEPTMRIEEAFEKKGGDRKDWSDIHHLVRRLQDTPATEDAFLRIIDGDFSLESYFDRMTWVSITQNLDAVRQNFYLYAEPVREGIQWHVLMWDADISFSNHWDVAIPSFDVAWRHMLHGGNHFSRRLVSIDSQRSLFVDQFEDRLKDELSTEALLPIAEVMFAPLSEAIDRDLVHWRRSSSAAEEWSEIENFLQERPELMKAFLQAFRTNPELEDAPY